MAAFIGNAIKALIESRVGVSCYRDAAPSDEQLPYCTVVDAIAVTPVDRSDGGVGGAARELVEVNLFESWRDVDNLVAESPKLAAELVRVLHSGELPTAPVRVHGMAVVSQRRILEPTRSIVRHAITVEVFHDL